MTANRLDASSYFIDIEKDGGTVRYYVGMACLVGWTPTKISFSEASTPMECSFALCFHPAVLSLHSIEHLCRVAIAQALKYKLFEMPKDHEDASLDLSIHPWAGKLEQVP